MAGPGADPGRRRAARPRPPELRRLALDVSRPGCGPLTRPPPSAGRSGWTGTSCTAGGRSIDLDAVARSSSRRRQGQLRRGHGPRGAARRPDRRRPARRPPRPVDSVAVRVEVARPTTRFPSEASVAAGRRLVELADAVRPRRSGHHRVHRRLVGAGLPAARRRLARGEAAAARAAARQRRLDRGGQHGPQARLGAEGRPAGRADGRGDDPQPHRLRRRRRLRSTCSATRPSRTPPTCRARSGSSTATGCGSRCRPRCARHLASDAAVSPSLASADITTVVLVTGDVVAERMAARASELGVQPILLGARLEGEALCLGSLLGALGRESSLRRPAVPRRLDAHCRGWRVDRLGTPLGARPGRRGRTQPGGRDRVRARRAGRADAVAAVFVDSDGSDGGTDGGRRLCRQHHLRARSRARHRPRRRAAASRLASALARLGDLVTTGPTGTNISDLMVVAVGMPTAADQPDAAGRGRG